MQILDLKITGDTSSTQLSENLRTLFENRNLNANRVAQELGIPMMTVRRLLSGETLDPRVSTLKLMADHLGISIDSLLSEQSESVLCAPKKLIPCVVPLLDWETLGKMDAVTDINLSGWKDWQLVSLGEQALSAHAFALESRRSMQPRFPQGTIFIFDPDATPIDGDIVLVKIKKNNELTLRELIIDAPEWQLQPVVPGSAMLHYSKEDHKIVGINVVTLFYSRRS